MMDMDIGDYHSLSRYPMDLQPSHVIMNLEEELKHNSGIGNGNAGDHISKGAHSTINGGELGA